MRFEGFRSTGDLLKDTQSFLASFGKTETAAHCACVSQRARELALRFGLNASLAVQAGLLHDLGTVIPSQDKVRFSREHGLEVLPEEELYPGILHQQHSVILAQNVFGIGTPAILSAIGCHTTLKVGASDLDKLVFLADKISWDQDGEPPYLAEVTKALDNSLDAACLAFMDWLLSPEGGIRVVHPWLKVAYKELGGHKSIGQD